MDSTLFIAAAIGAFIGGYLYSKYAHDKLEQKYKEKLEQAKQQANLEAYTDQEVKKTTVIMLNYWELAQQFSKAFLNDHQLQALSKEYPRLKLTPEHPLLSQIIFDGFYKYETKHPTSLKDRAIQAYLISIREEVEKTTRAKKAKPLTVCWIKDRKRWKAEPQNSINHYGELPDDWQWRRRVVIERDQHICQRCGFELAKQGQPERHIHHIVERSEGGNHEISNLILLCGECHTCMPAHEWMRTEYSFQPFEHHAFKQAYFRLNTVNLDSVSKLKEISLNDPHLVEGFRVLRKKDDQSYSQELKALLEP